MVLLTANTESEKRRPFAAEQAKPQPSTLAEKAYLQLREDIAHGQLEAGSKLRIEQLRDHYGIGPTPLREALSRLAADGFVTTEGQRGFRVAQMSPEELEDITNMRILLENQALRRSILTGDDNWEANIVGAFHRLAKLETSSQKERDIGEWERRNSDFHDALVTACRSIWLRRFSSVLYDQHKRYRNLARAGRFVGRDIHAEHRAIYEATLARDADAACAANEQHIRATANSLLHPTQD